MLTDAYYAVEEFDFCNAGRLVHALGSEALCAETSSVPVELQDCRFYMPQQRVQVFFLSPED